MVRTIRVFEDPHVAANRQTSSLAGLALTLGLIVAGLYLVKVFRAEAAAQECFLTGRVECQWARSGVSLDVATVR
jgi:hypothetical protein